MYEFEPSKVHNKSQKARSNQLVKWVMIPVKMLPYTKTQVDVHMFLGYTKKAKAYKCNAASQLVQASKMQHSKKQNKQMVITSYNTTLLFITIIMSKQNQKID